MYYPPSTGGCTIRSTFVSQKTTTDPASSTIVQLDENQIISELARMSGGVEINETTLQHAKQLRQLKFQASST